MAKNEKSFVASLTRVWHGHEERKKKETGLEFKGVHISHVRTFVHTSCIVPSNRSIQCAAA